MNGRKEIQVLNTHKKKVQSNDSDYEFELDVEAVISDPEDG